MRRLMLLLLVAVSVGAMPTGSALAQQSRVFVTSTISDGILFGVGGLAGGDQECEARATAGGLGGGPWVAWLSTSAVNAVDRLTPGSGPFVRAVSGVLIANDIADLTDGTLAHAILEDENGNVAGVDAWTGTLADGTAAAATCFDWTTNNVEAEGMRGDFGGSGIDWTAEAIEPCSGGVDCVCGVYCFEAPVGVPALPTPAALLLALLLAGAGAVYLHRRRRPAR